MATDKLTLAETHENRPYIRVADFCSVSSVIFAGEQV